MVKRGVDQPRIGAAKPKLAHRFVEGRGTELVDHPAPGPGTGMDHDGNLPVPQPPGFGHRPLFFGDFNLLNLYEMIAAA
ncbi:hypothetical protein D3C73_1472100 [compost metagenome]